MDGRIAQFTVLGEVLPDRRDLVGMPVDVAAAQNGGR